MRGEPCARCKRQFGGPSKRETRAGHHNRAYIATPVSLQVVLQDRWDLTGHNRPLRGMLGDIPDALACSHIIEFIVWKEIPHPACPETVGVERRVWKTP